MVLYMMKGRYPKAFEPLRRLRHTDLQAVRDLYCTSCLILTLERGSFAIRRLTRGGTDVHVLLEAENLKEVNEKDKKTRDRQRVPRSVHRHA